MRSYNRNGDNYELIIYILFSLYLVFQFTTLKWIFDLNLISRIINIACFAFCVLIFLVALVKKYPRSFFFRIMIPLLLIVAGISLNLGMSILSFNTSSMLLLAKIYPYLLAVVIMSIYNSSKTNYQKLWSFFYHFMLIVTIFSFIDYAMVHLHLISLKPVRTSGGQFYKGIFNLYYIASDGSLSPRFYGIFGEPGGCGMWASILIVYSYYNKYWISFVLFLIAGLMSLSLGSYFALVFMLYASFVLKNSASKVTILFMPVFILVLSLFLSQIGLYKSLNNQYMNKGGSRTTRTNNFSNAIINLPLAIIHSPLGVPPQKTTAESHASDKDYIGTNFSVYTAFQNGGILSLMGYCLLVYNLMYLSFKFYQIRQDNDARMILITTMVSILYIVQRKTIFDTAMFAFLICPYLYENILNLSKTSNVLSINSNL